MSPGGAHGTSRERGGKPSGRLTSPLLARLPVQASAVEEEELLLVNEEQLEEERRLHEEREREEAAGQVCAWGLLLGP